MRRGNRVLIGAASMFAFAAATAATLGPTATTWAAENERETTEQAGQAANRVHLQLTPSSDQLAQCMPRADVDVNVRLTTDQLGYDIFDVTARNIAPNRDYTVF